MQRNWSEFDNGRLSVSQYQPDRLKPLDESNYLKPIEPENGIQTRVVDGVTEERLVGIYKQRQRLREKVSTTNKRNRQRPNSKRNTPHREIITDQNFKRPTWLNQMQVYQCGEYLKD